MVNPNVVGAIQVNGITAPDVLRVKLGDMDVLDDDVFGIVGHAKSLATEDTSTTDTNNGLVRGNRQAFQTSVIIGAFRRWIVTAPVGTVRLDGVLARAAAGVGVRNTALAVSTSVLAADEVELLVYEDHTGSVITQPGLQFSDATGGRWACISTTCSAAGESKSGALDAFSTGISAQESRCGKKITE